ncbi:MAG: S-layer homology domain-containing protein, partial [Oscillospiraceae bacterium]|nr:S-layer homology domain-containing protein [Oscillospiraceae bacterium]
LGIVSGKTETSFCPKDPVTREQMVTILYNYACLFGEQAADLSLLDSFEDAGRVGNYARTPMAWAVSVGVISGRTPTTLDPKGNATRAEIASILMRFIRYMAA